MAIIIPSLKSHQIEILRQLGIDPAFHVEPATLSLLRKRGLVGRLVGHDAGGRQKTTSPVTPAGRAFLGIDLAARNLTSGAEMTSSAVLCHAEARKCFEGSDFLGALRKAIDSLAYSVGILHADHAAAKALSAEMVMVAPPGVLLARIPAAPPFFVADIPDEIRDVALMLNDTRKGAHVVGVLSHRDVGQIWAIREQDDEAEEVTREQDGAIFRRIAWASNLRETENEE